MGGWISFKNIQYGFFYMHKKVFLKESLRLGPPLHLTFGPETLSHNLQNVNPWMAKLDSRGWNHNYQVSQGLDIHTYSNTLHS